MNQFFASRATRWHAAVQGLFILTLLTMATFGSAFAQNKKEEKAVKACIEKFATAADEQNIEELSDVLHPSYRSVLNKAFGAENATILTKESYIGMAKEGKIGGSERSLKIVSMDVEDHIASAKVILESDALQFTSYFSMLKNEEGEWQMVSDMPLIVKKQN